MEAHFEPHAPNAAEHAGSGAIRAFPSRTTGRESFGIAGTADGAAASSSKPLDRAVEIWARDQRGLTKETLAHLPVVSGTAVYFPELKRDTPAVVFKYQNGWKARSIEGKAFVAGKGFQLSFWNLDAVLRAVTKDSTVYVVEGELDACALVEAGVPFDAVLSVPNGAKQHSSDDPKAQAGYQFVSDALKAGLSKVKTVVWCGDHDAPGLTLRSDMLALFGEARFHFVEWPEDCKDANDVLTKHSPDHLFQLVTQESKPWPVNGLFRISELPDPPPLTLWDPGFAEWEGKVLLAPRTLSVATGHPGHGKTQLWSQIWYQVARAYGLGVCVASFETRAKPHLRRYLRSYFWGRLEKHLTAREIAQADEWIEGHYLFAAHPEHKPTLKWLLDMAEVAVVRHGVRVIQVDPWNRLESARSDRETETDYIGRCLRELHAFAHDMNCHVQILAHPAKMEGNRRGQAPNLEDISGSKNWDNAVDQGFVVHRPEMFDGTQRRTEAILYHRKSRFEELGYPCKLNLDYVVDQGRYRSTDYDPGADINLSKRMTRGRKEAA